MKQILSTSWAMLIVMIMSVLHVTAKDFKGVITYKISVSGSGVTDEVKSMMPKTMTLMIKGNKSRSEMTMMMGTTITITDGDKQTSVALLDMMGQKIAIESTAEDIEKESADAPKATVNVTGETKEILGYTCKKAVITFEGEDTEIVVYYTNELGSKELNFRHSEFKDIDGVMLEYEMPNEQFTLQFTATSVEKKNVDDSEFTIPDGYQKKTKEEMKSMFGG